MGKRWRTLDNTKLAELKNLKEQLKQWTHMENKIELDYNAIPGISSALTPFKRVKKKRRSTNGLDAEYDDLLNANDIRLSIIKDKNSKSSNGPISNL